MLVWAPQMDPLEQAIVQIGGVGKLATAIGVKGQTLHHWRKRGMPRTDWTGETDYAKRIERVTNRKVRAADLLSKKARAA